MRFAALVLVLQQSVDSCNVVKWKQKNVFHCVVLLILIVIQQSVDSCNVVNWVRKIVLHCVVLLIVIVVKQSEYF